MYYFAKEAEKNAHRKIKNKTIEVTFKQCNDSCSAKTRSLNCTVP